MRDVFFADEKFTSWSFVKILICETADECLAYNYFGRVYFFFAPIILDMF